MHPSTLLAALAVGATSVYATPRYRQQARQAPPPGVIAPEVARLSAELLPQNVASNDPTLLPDPQFLPPDFGIQRGIPLGDGSDNCRGANGKGINCTCPPDVDDVTFLETLKIALNTGFFPDPSTTVPIRLDDWNNGGNGPEIQAQRNLVMVICLQSLTGFKGRGCPGVSAPALASGSG